MRHFPFPKFSALILRLLIITLSNCAPFPFWYAKVIQQLSEYGVLFYRVFHEKKTVGGDLLLGICAKGIIVYEVKNHIRISSLRFQWQEMERISAQVSGCRMCFCSVSSLIVSTLFLILFHNTLVYVALSHELISPLTPYLVHEAQHLGVQL